MQTTALSAHSVSYQYSKRLALNNISLEIFQGEIFGLLGPNGGGKTTLFRLLSTLLPLQKGKVFIFENDLVKEPQAVRRHLGIIFQSPSLDGKLRVIENLYHQGHLYGMCGKVLKQRIEVLLAYFNLEDRAKEMVEHLSGGQQRRVEIAKALLHSPRLLFMDEPSNGLDPVARRDLWELIHRLRREENMTVLLTTHLMEEAEHCDRVAILNQGNLIVNGSPAALRAAVGGEVLSLKSGNLMLLAEKIQKDFALSACVMQDEVRIEYPDAARLLLDIKIKYPELIQSARLGQPTLEDVFVKETGHRLSEGGQL